MTTSDRADTPDEAERLLPALRARYKAMLRGELRIPRPTPAELAEVIRLYERSQRAGPWPGERPANDADSPGVVARRTAQKGDRDG